MSRTLAQLRLVTAAVFTFGLAWNAHALMVLDQSLETGTDATAFVTPGFTFQQGVTAGRDGTLKRVEIEVAQIFTPGSINFFINLGAPWQFDANDFMTTVVIDSLGWIAIDILVDIPVVADTTQFAIGLSGDPRAVVAFAGNTAGNAYTRGSLWQRNGAADPMERLQDDINFRTFVYVADSMPPPTTVPEPNGLLLLLIGLTALTFVSLERRARI